MPSKTGEEFVNFDFFKSVLCYIIDKKFILLVIVAHPKRNLYHFHLKSLLDCFVLSRYSFVRTFLRTSSIVPAVISCVRLVLVVCHRADA